MEDEEIKQPQDLERQSSLAPSLATDRQSEVEQELQRLKQLQLEAEQERLKLQQEKELYEKAKEKIEPIEDEVDILYTQIVGGEKNMSKRVSDWPSNDYLRGLSTKERNLYQINSVQWVKGTHFGVAEDYANSLRFTTNLGEESPLYSNKSPDASFSVSKRIAQIKCRTNYHHVFCFKFFDDFGELIGQIYSNYDQKSEDEFTIDIGLDEKVVGFKVWESDWVDCKTSKIAFKLIKTDQFTKDVQFMERLEKFKSKTNLYPTLGAPIDAGQPQGSKSWFCIHYSDFCFGDRGSEGCNSFEKAVGMVLTKPQNSQTAYQYWVGHQRLFTKPTIHEATWTNQHTGSGLGPAPVGNLFLWGINTGVKKHNRTLFCMKDCSIAGGDSGNNNGIGSYQQALDHIRNSNNNHEHAYVWDSNSQRLIHKAASKRSGKWAQQSGHWLFIWADKVIDPNYAKKKQEADKAAVKDMKHVKFENWRAGQHTWTQSRRIAQQHGGMLVTADQAKQYIRAHGALVHSQGSWTATEEPNGVKNWVSCGEKNPEGIAKDHRSHYHGYPAWGENLDWSCLPYGQCHWAGQIVIYKPAPANTTIQGETVGQRKTYELTLRSHDGKAMTKNSDEYQHEGTPVDWFMVGPRNNAVHVYFEKHENGVFIRMDHRSDDGALDCAKGQYHSGNDVVAWRCHKGGNQWFCVNADGTITPTHAPNMCLGFKGGKIKLVERFEPTGDGFFDKMKQKFWDDDRIIFDAIPPTLSPQKIMPLILSSHPGKAIVLKNSTKQHGHGMEEFIKVGDAQNAISIFVDEDNHIHNAYKHYQTFDGYQHTHRDLEFFTKHVEYPHQKYKPLQDGTILFLHDKNYVLGTDSGANRVMHVRKDSPHKFIFRDIQYLVKDIDDLY